MAFVRCGISNMGAAPDAPKEISNGYITKENDSYIIAMVSAYAVKTGGGNNTTRISTVSCGSNTLSLSAVSSVEKVPIDKGAATAVWEIQPGQTVSISTKGAIETGCAGYTVGTAKAFII